MTDQTKELAKADKLDPTVLKDTLDHLEKQACQMVEIAAEMDAIVFDPAHPASPHRRMEVLQILQKRHQDTFRPEVSKALEAVLRDMLTRAVEANKVTPETRDAMAGWRENANPEALVAWLENGGWEKVDADKLRTALDEVAGKDISNALKTVLALRLWGGLGGILYEKITRENCLEEKKPARWLRLLAAPWLQDAAEREAERQAERQQLEAARMEREAKARPLALRTVRTANGEEYARLPKLAAGISWAFGGAGVQLPEGYKAAPNIAALVPPGYALLKETDLARPHQAALPMLVEGDDSPPLMLAVAGTNRDVFTPAAAALAVYVMASNWDKPDVLQETTLRELTRAIYPDAPRLRADKHYAAVAEALGMMRNARILWPNGYADALFYVPRWTWKTPDPEALDAPLVVGLDQHFLQRTLPDIAAATGGKSLGGQFVFNLTGAMSLDKDRPGLLRQYLRAVATGDAFWAHGTGKPSPDMVPEVDAVRWAVLTNYLPGGHGLHGKDPRPTGRVAKSNALKRMLADIAYLEGKGLVKVGTASKKAVRLLLTPEHLDAWDAFRAGKARKAKG